MRTLARTLTITLASIGLAGTAISPAYATQMEKMTIAVPTADINLASAEGQRTLDQRLEKAARTVCRSSSPTTGSRILGRESRDCLAKARSDARQQLAMITQGQQRGG